MSKFIISATHVTIKLDLNSPWVGLVLKGKELSTRTTLATATAIHSFATVLCLPYSVKLASSICMVEDTDIQRAVQEIRLSMRSKTYVWIHL